MRSIISNPYIILELKMIFRNKKPQQNFYQIVTIYVIMVFMLLYINNSSVLSNFTSPLFSVIISILCGIFMYLHGLFLLTWESTFFEGLNTLNINILSFLKAKFWLLLLSMITLLFTNTILLLIINVNLIYPLFAITSLNIGISSFLVIIYSLYNNERAELNKSIFLNHEGYGFWQYLFMMALIAFPTLIIMLLNSFFSYNYVYALLMFIGMFSLTLSKYWFRIILAIYIKRKYIILNKFNEKV